MAQKKFDGVLEAVHYKPDGQVDWVRAYLRRGAAFSDRILLDRQTLINQMRAGKVFLLGKRVPQMGSSFTVSLPVHLIQRTGKELLVAGTPQSDRDYLEDLPLL